MAAGAQEQEIMVRPDRPIDRLAEHGSGRRTLSMTRSLRERAVTTVVDH
jgi:hypothetical protein